MTKTIFRHQSHQLALFRCVLETFDGEGRVKSDWDRPIFDTNPDSGSVCHSSFYTHTHKPRSILTHDYLFISKVPEHKINKHIHFLHQVKFYI